MSSNTVLSRLTSFRTHLRDLQRTAQMGNRPVLALAYLDIIRDLNKTFPELGEAIDGDNYI